MHSEGYAISSMFNNTGPSLRVPAVCLNLIPRHLPQLLLLYTIPSPFVLLMVEVMYGWILVRGESCRHLVKLSYLRLPPIPLSKGNKLIGVQILQEYLGPYAGNQTLHVGDQFLSTGNDLATRSACCTTWITSPKETYNVLMELESLLLKKNK